MSDPPVTVANAFTYLANLSLPHQHFLHPQSCNPAMDLLALLSPGGPAASVKGKEKALGPDTRGWTDTKVSVWRMMSDQVWAVDVKGRPLGLAWSLDGLVLSVILSRPALVDRQLRKAIYIEHLSVHTGELVKSVNLGLHPYEVDELSQRPAWPGHIEWRDLGSIWEEERPGSAMCILDALPAPKPVDPPKPVQLNPFAKPPPPPNPNIPHSRLLSFPSLLPSNPPIDPHILAVQLGTTRQTLLTGSFPVASPDQDGDMAEKRISEQTLRVAQLSDRLLGLYNTYLRGLDAVDVAWREVSKQNMIWREELEGCASQHGISKADAHADLFRFLMTGRSNEAVSEWLGAKLTGRTLTKWGETLDNNLATIRATIVNSIVPALERALVIFEEMSGWQLSKYHSGDLILDKEEIRRPISLTQQLVKLFHRIRLDVEHEALAAQAWMAWLKYETAKAGASGIDEHPPVVTHDLKLTWSFMKNGFVKSVLSLYFPDVHPRPPIDEIPPEHLEPPAALDAPALADSVRDVLASLEKHRPKPKTNHQSGPQVPSLFSDLGTRQPDVRDVHAWVAQSGSNNTLAPVRPAGPSGAVERGDESSSSMSMSVDDSADTMSASAMDVEVEQSMDMSMNMTMDVSMDGDASMGRDGSTATNTAADRRVYDRDDDDDDNDSTATFDPEAEEEEEPPRFLELEPWVWSNSLLKASEAVMRRAVPLSPSPARSSDVSTPDGVAKAASTRLWRTSEGEWAVRLSPDRQRVIIATRAIETVKPKAGTAGAESKRYGEWHGGVLRISEDAGSSTRVLALEFFDDVELALVVADDDGTQLATIDYGPVADQLSVVAGAAVGGDVLGVLAACEGILTEVYIPFRRSRTLDLPAARHSAHPDPADGDSGVRIDIALNGRKGRRVGCVMVRGQKEVGVWDMEVDEGDGDEEEAGEEEME